MNYYNLTEQQILMLVCGLAAIMIGLFVFSNKQKRAHEDKMAQLRRDRKAMVEKAKQDEAANTQPAKTE